MTTCSAAPQTADGPGPGATRPARGPAVRLARLHRLHRVRGPVRDLRDHALRRRVPVVEQPDQHHPQTAPISIMAIAVTFVIAAAQIDLSVGSVAGLTSVTTAMAIEAWGGILGVIVGVLIGAVIGVINGLLVVYFRIPSFLVTLGMLGIASGLAMWITNSAPKPILDQTYNNVFGSGDLRAPDPRDLDAVAVVIGHVILRAAVRPRRARDRRQRGGGTLQRRPDQADRVHRDGRLGGRRRDRRHALRGPPAVGALLVGPGRRAVGHRGRDPRRHEPVRRPRHRDRRAARLAADRADQQRVLILGPRVQPAADRPRRHHHPRRRGRRP